MGNGWSVSQAVQAQAQGNGLDGDRHRRPDVVRAAQRVVLLGRAPCPTACANCANRPAANPVLEAAAVQAAVWRVRGHADAARPQRRGRHTDGLGLIQARWPVRPGRAHAADGSRFKVPQMGWNQVRQVPHNGCAPGVGGNSPTTATLFRAQLYAQPQSAAHCAGEADYGGFIAAAIARDNIFAASSTGRRARNMAWPCTATFCTGTLTDWWLPCSGYPFCTSPFSTPRTHHAAHPRHRPQRRPLRSPQARRYGPIHHLR